MWYEKRAIAQKMTKDRIHGRSSVAQQQAEGGYSALRPWRTETEDGSSRTGRRGWCALLGQSGASPCVTPHLQSTIAGQWKRYRWYLQDKKRWFVSSENEPQS